MNERQLYYCSTVDLVVFIIVQCPAWTLKFQPARPGCRPSLRRFLRRWRVQLQLAGLTSTLGNSDFAMFRVGRVRGLLVLRGGGGGGRDVVET